MDKAKSKGCHQKYAVKLGYAKAQLIAAESLHQDTETLVNWLQHDVLQLAGLPPEDRNMLYDFIVEHIIPLAEQNDRIKTFRNSLVYQKSSLMKAVDSLNTKLELIAQKYNIPVQTLWDIAYLARYDINSPTYHVKSELLEQRVGDKYDDIEDEVLVAIEHTDRSSSMVENFNSRLSPYLDERKGFQDDRLPLFQFILNHRPFQRSKHKHLKGKTAAEAMTGHKHPHWLELLGYERFQLAA